MRRMPCNLEGKGVLQLLEAGSFWGSVCGSSRKRKGIEGLEPKSVLDSRRSPSPPTSSSNLSSSLGGGGGSSDTSGVAVVSDVPYAGKCPPFSDSTNTSSSDAGAGPVSDVPAASLEMGLAGGGDKCGMGVDWEAMLSGSAASPTQEQTFLQWIMADNDDSTVGGGGLKQQFLHQAAVDFDGNGVGGLGFGLVDPGFGFESMGASVSSAIVPLASGGGFPPMSSGMSVKVPNFGNPGNKPIFTPANSFPLPLSLPPGILHQESMDERTLFFGSGLLLNQYHDPSPNPAFFLSLPPTFSAQLEGPQPPHLVLPPHPKRHHPAIVEPTCQIPPKARFPDSAGPKALFPDSAGLEFFLRRNQHQQQGFSPPNAASYHHQQRQMKPKIAGDEPAAELAAQQQQQQQQALVDQLFKVAELIEAGNSVSARGILARLNQQLPSPIGKPLLRSAFYFKEAFYLLTNPTPSSSLSVHLATPLDVVLKLSTYKAFSEVSPVLQFTNFTSIQTLLEELNGSDRIHIIDFDIGVGGQWSSFMQELAHRRSSSAATGTPLLKITAFASACSHHPLELHLTRENLSHFASDLNIPFEFNALSLDSFDPSVLLSMCAGVGEAIAVNLPAGSAYHPPVPSLLHLVKQLSPKIVVSVDHGCDRCDLPFSHQFLHAFQSCTVLLDSIDATGTDPDAANKIERFLLQPRIENALLGRHRATEKVPPWQTLFASAGFVPVQFSNFTETQAECLLKRLQVRGFRVEKRQASLNLFWQHGELVSVSAWRC